ncbi:cell wall-associated hydrolase domain protein [Orientia tsutsugamushi str. Gilliam]|uniref:Cell wall-associated hydrolase domain protein n=3 Tax=Orientia tsutsugamushi TaxID=784 RepID=A0A0F3M819_ORITS|nr:cell wall-associated hydrolase domain protein [Orientia tsutsugamushi str. Gilliam]KJV56808.1 cell wall-associated hydrolase domain protein [Orientia tsutsugamushi str. Karp]KJV56829.1 cell wall-associated hydrolase domain protein [Orientia tsutsugamushi str. Kato PP]KJV75979.1 cell wall-associated hydrolase domain protein [Orientia tsutsugamushi str. TA763]KJV77652.1 cell wall-associated hydrolase domain protein [Orientia tsutsugamushi str. TA716]KJV97418.1 cell wall-associated hydrolase d
MHSAVISSVLSYPAVPLARQLVHHRYVHLGPLVLKAGPLKSPTPTADRDQTVSRRSKPSSRTTLIGEQPNLWDILQPRDVMSRHRGAKRFRRYGLLEIISLLSPEYLLFVERWPFHSGPPDHYDRLSSLLVLSDSQSG